jgi:hypothetical protein
VRAVTLGALVLGDRLDATTPLGRLVRGAVVRVVGAWSGLRELLRRRALRRPPLDVGLVAGRAPCRGELLPLVRTPADDWLDDVVGYRGALVAPSDTLDPDDVAWAEANDFAVVRPDLDDAGELGGWLAERGVGCVLVRPDRHVFGAGPTGGLAPLRAAFDRGTRDDRDDRDTISRAAAAPPRAGPRRPAP